MNFPNPPIGLTPHRSVSKGGCTINFATLIDVIINGTHPSIGDGNDALQLALHYASLRTPQLQAELRRLSERRNRHA